MMNHLLALVLCVVAVAAQAQPLEFKGIQFGSSWEAFNKSALGSSESEGMLGSFVEGEGTITITGVTFAEQPTKFVVGHFLDGKLGMVSVVFNAAHYVEIRDTIASKYGKPKERRSMVQNRMGASFDQLAAEWQTSDKGTITALLRGTNVDESVVTMSSAMYQTELAKRKAVRPATAKNDI